MPEGPENRVTADQLNSLITGKYIHDWSFNPGYKIKSEFILDRIFEIPRKIIKIFAYGKKVIWHVEDNIYIVFSFLMTGKLVFNKLNNTHVKFILSDRENKIKHKQILYYDDSRKFGNIIITDDLDPILNKLGPDLLQHALNEPIPLKIFKKRYLIDKNLNKSISFVLLDQSIFSGIGNYLKADILYKSKIHPDRNVRDITNQEWKILHYYCHKIIEKSYLAGGCTLESFLAPNSQLGIYKPSVYRGPKFKTMTDKHGNKIIKSTFRDKRTTFWVPVIQK